MRTYAEFLAAKRQFHDDAGFPPLWIPDFLYDFQRSLTEWAIRKGRAALLADCGLGKTPMALVWAQNIVQKTNQPVLIFTPIAVSYQFVHEGEKFGVPIHNARDLKIEPGINVVNYEQMHHFDPQQFGGVVCDESSCIKHMKSKRKQQVVEFLRTRPYRLLCTATAAPNDYFELGTSSEALGYLGFQDMLTRFFKEQTKKDYLGWGRKTYRFRGHAEEPFWRWVCSWARSCRKPSDLGFDNGPFVLPPLHEREHVLECSQQRPGMLFAMPARNLQEQREERRQTLTKRCELICNLVIEHNEPAVVWCHLNPEGKLLAELIPESLEVSGSLNDTLKEERLLAFQLGQLKRLVIKPKIGAWGLNWQHCHRVTTFPSHSFEQYYQSVRRCWRFGQTEPVNVEIVTTEGEANVLKNLQRKAVQCDQMFDQIVQHMTTAMHVYRDISSNMKEQVPSWLLSTSN